MNHKTLAAIACVALACGGSAWAQSSTGGTSEGSAATSPDGSTPPARHAKKRHHAGSKAASRDAANGVAASPTGGGANPKDVSPGTYNASGAAVPTTSDPAQTKNTRDGSPLPSAKRAASASGR
jgi:hypothetical protein